MEKIIKVALKTIIYRKLWVTMICVINTMISLLPPLYIGKLIDILTQGTNIDMNQSLRIGGILIFLTMAAFFFNWYQNLEWYKLVHNGVLKVRETVLNYMILNHYEFFEKNNSGEIIQKALNDSALYGQNKTIKIPMFIINISTLVIVFIIMLSLNLSLAVYSGVSCVIYFFVYKFLSKSINKNSQKQSEASGMIMTSLKQIIDGIEIIKLYHKETYFSKKYYDTIHSYKERTIKLQFFKSFGMSITLLISLSMPIGVLLLGLWLVANGNTTVGIVVSFYAYMPHFIEPLKNLCDFNMLCQEAKGVEERVFSLINNDNKNNGESKIDQIAKIDFNDINFSYTDFEDIFKDFNLSIKKGDRIAITGGSGTGKSTLIKMLLGQIYPQGNQVKINDIEMNEIDYQSYLNRISIVTQKLFLFGEDVEENICFGSKVENLDKILESSCLDRGILSREASNLSGGEAQRIGFARSIAKPFDLLILDEPTSALDIKTEKKIIKNLDQILKERNAILIVITHRTPIIEICDKQIKISKDKGCEIHYL